MKTIRAFIDRHDKERGDKTFLIAPDTQRALTFATLKSNVDTIGAELNRLGIRQGVKVAFLLNNGFWTAQLFLGVMANNRTVVPLNAVAGNVQLTHVLGHSDAEVVFVSQEYREKLDLLMQEVDRQFLVIECSEAEGIDWPQETLTESICCAAPTEEDSALLLYTSGSTGLPKGAVLNHLAVVSGGLNVGGGHGLTTEDRALCVLPIYHINGAMVTVSAPLISGSSVVMPEKFKVSQFWSLIAAYNCTWSSIVPTIIKYLLDRVDQEDFNFSDDARLKQFRFARSASAPLPAVVLGQWEDTFQVPMIETIGLTETAGTVATNPMPPMVRKLDSVGLAVGNEIKVFDGQHKECGSGVEGEIVIRGNNVLKAYYKNPEATASSFVDGWFLSGDLGKRDDEGYLYITGRLKELIIRGGENIAPREIDDALYKHEAILEAAAFGVDDDNYGQEVVACVALRDGFSCSEEELKAFCERSVGLYKTPKNIYFMKELPKGPSGKILRLKLADMI